MIIKTPFDIMNHLGKSSYNEISNIDKKRHSFIINRMMSRTLPDVAIDMSHMKMIPETVVDFWHCAFMDMSRTPRGMKILSHIRSAFRISMAGAKKKVSKKIDSDLSKKYMQISKIGQKEFGVLSHYYEKELIKYLKKLSYMIETTK